MDKILDISLKFFIENALEYGKRCIGMSKGFKSRDWIFRIHQINSFHKCVIEVLNEQYPNKEQDRVYKNLKSALDIMCVLLEEDNHYFITWNKIMKRVADNYDKF